MRACGEQERQQGVSGFYAEQIIRVKIPPRSLKLQHLALLQCLCPAWVMRCVVPGAWGDTVPAAMSPNGTSLIPHPDDRADSSLEAFFPPHHSSALAPALPPCTNTERNPQLWVRQNQAQGTEMGKKHQGSRRLAGSGCRNQKGHPWPCRFARHRVVLPGTLRCQKAPLCWCCSWAPSLSPHPSVHLHQPSNPPGA